jgi:hypothetical protein
VCSVWAGSANAVVEIGEVRWDQRCALSERAYSPSNLADSGSGTSFAPGPIACQSAEFQFSRENFDFLVFNAVDQVSATSPHAIASRGDAQAHRGEKYLGQVISGSGSSGARVTFTPAEAVQYAFSTLFVEAAPANHPRARSTVRVVVVATSEVVFHADSHGPTIGSRTGSLAAGTAYRLEATASVESHRDLSDRAKPDGDVSASYGFRLDFEPARKANSPDGQAPAIEPVTPSPDRTTTTPSTAVPNRAPSRASLRDPFER